jgi:hypothetical protein
MTKSLYIAALEIPSSVSNVAKTEHGVWSPSNIF